MRVTMRNIAPSREDAVRLTRTEKTSLIVLAYAATILDDLQKEIPDRLGIVTDGMARTKTLAIGTEELLNDLRLTVPMDQRMSLQNTANDYEMRLTPKATPTNTGVVMQREEFRMLVDAARIKCRDCTLDDWECEQCELYRLLTCVLPMEDYHHCTLCPYNLGEWAN